MVMHSTINRRFPSMIPSIERKSQEMHCKAAMARESCSIAAKAHSIRTARMWFPRVSQSPLLVFNMLRSGRRVASGTRPLAALFIPITSLNARAAPLPRRRSLSRLQVSNRSQRDSGIAHPSHHPPPLAAGWPRSSPPRRLSLRLPYRG